MPPSSFELYYCDFNFVYHITVAVIKFIFIYSILGYSKTKKKVGISMSGLSDRFHRVLIRKYNMSIKEFSQKFDLQLTSLYNIASGRTPNTNSFAEILEKTDIQANYLLCPYVKKDKNVLVHELVDLLDTLTESEQVAAYLTIEHFLKIIPELKQISSSFTDLMEVPTFKETTYKNDETPLSPDLKIIGLKVAQNRNCQHMTHDELANTVGITLSYLYRIESGKAVPALPLIIRLANALDVSSNDLFYKNPPPEIKYKHSSTTAKLESMHMTDIIFITKIIEDLKEFSRVNSESEPN